MEGHNYWFMNILECSNGVPEIYLCFWLYLHSYHSSVEGTRIRVNQTDDTYCDLITVVLIVKHWLYKIMMKMCWFVSDHYSV